MTLSTPVPLMQHEREFETLLELYREERPQSVLEIGVAHGGTLYHWLENARSDARVLVVAVDTFEQYDCRKLAQLWAPPTVDLRFIEGRSTDTSTIRRVFSLASRYDWVFIDGDHSYDVARIDWLAYGVSAHTVVFHDIVSSASTHPEIEVGRLWRELTREHDTLEIVDEREADWGGLGVVWP